MVKVRHDRRNYLLGYQALPNATIGFTDIEYQPRSLRGHVQLPVPKCRGSPTMVP
jgi:hypothetical protein